MVSKLDRPRQSGDIQKDITNLYKYLEKLSDEYNHTINSLDETNLSESFVKQIAESRQQVTKKVVNHYTSNTVSALLYASEDGASAGSTVTLNDNAQDYRFLMFRFSGTWNFAIAYVSNIQTTINDFKGNVVRGDMSINTDTAIINYYVYALVNGCSIYFDTLTRNSMNLSNGAGASTNRTVIEIWGVK